MNTRTISLDEEAEQTLERLERETGLTVSELLKRGLSAYEVMARDQTSRRPIDVFRELDLGTGGSAHAPARGAKSAVARIIRKHQSE